MRQRNPKERKSVADVCGNTKFLCLSAAVCAGLCHECQSLLLLLLLLLVRLQDSNAQLTTQLKGLSVKAQSRLLEDAAGGAPGPADSVDAPSAASYRPAVAQEVAISILEPCDVRVVLKASAAVQDVALDVSALQLRMSPDVMQLLLHLHKVRANICWRSKHMFYC
jgi:hypothetical protein